MMCWSCGRVITDRTHYRLRMVERRYTERGQRDGNELAVVLCITCAEDVSRTLEERRSAQS